MNRKVPPRVQFQYEPDLKPEPVDDEPEEEFESYEEEVGEPPAVTANARMPEVVGKEEIVGETIFEYPDNIAVMPDEVKENLKYEGMEDGIDYMENIKEPSKPRIKSPAPEPKKTKSGRKPRKPMTQEQKDKLAQARVKAVQVKKAKAEERKRQKELEMEEKELLKQRKAKNLQKLREEVSESPKPAPQEGKVVHQQVTGLTRKDLEEAQYEAISKYEILRKQRKEEKRKLMAQEKQKRELIEKLKPDNNGYRARDQNGKLKNRWDMCY